MNARQWLRRVSARCPLAFPAMAAVAAVFYVDHPSLGAALACVALVLLSLFAGRVFVVLAVSVGILAGALHGWHLDKMERGASQNGDWWRGKVWVKSELRSGKVFAESEEGNALQVWLPEGIVGVEIGDAWQMSGRMISPKEAMNPDVFDEKQWLSREGVSQVLVVRDARKMSGEPSRFMLQRVTATVRNALAERLTQGLDRESDAAKIILAMTLGQRPQQSVEMLEAFRNSGAIHVFAVSGLHVMMVGSLVAAVLRLAGCKRGVWVPVVVLSLFFYAMVTGMRPPAFRAAVMGAVLLGAWLVRRRIVLGNSVAFALIVTLLWDGNQLFQPGFQLSFAVLIAIALLSDFVGRAFLWVGYMDPFLPRSLYTKTQEWGLQMRRKVQGALVVGSCAWCGSSPLTWTYFRLIAPISIVVSVPLVLLLYGILALSGMSLFVGAISENAGKWVNAGNARLAGLAQSVAESAARIPYGHVQNQDWNQSECVVVYSLPDGGAACYIGVGGGVMVDVGNASAFQYEVAPSLKKRAAKIDSLVLTHADSRHCGGVEELLKLANVRQVLLPERGAPSVAYQEALAAMKSSGVDQLIPADGQYFRLDDASFLEVIRAPEIEGGLADDRCLAVRLHWRGRKILFLSDLGYAFEQWAAVTARDVSADMVILGKHSRDLPISDDFMQRVGAQWIVADGFTRELEQNGHAYSLQNSGALQIEPARGTLSLRSHKRGMIGQLSE